MSNIFISIDMYQKNSHEISLLIRIFELVFVRLRIFFSFWKEILQVFGLNFNKVNL